MKKTILIILLALFLSAFQEKQTKPSKFTGEVIYSVIEDDWSKKQNIHLFFENGVLAMKKYGEISYNPKIKKNGK